MSRLNGFRGVFRSTAHRCYPQVTSLSSSTSASSLSHRIPETSSRLAGIRPRKSDPPKILSLHPQITSLWRALDLSAISYRYLATDTTTQEQTNAKNPSGAASVKEEGSGSSDSGSAKKPVRGAPVSWLSLLLLLVTGGGLIVYYDKEKKRRIEELKTASTAPKDGPSIGTPAIGGPFKLVNHKGESVTEKDFLGKWTLIYFGFTHCPDICPDELWKLAAAVDKVKGRTGMEIVPVFISVDPERDTVEQVGEYVKEFHPDLIGLTGTPEEIRQVARAYRVYYHKKEEEDSDYLVDHSIVIYLMDPKMEFTKFFGKNYDVDMLADGIIKVIKEHIKRKSCKMKFTSSKTRGASWKHMWRNEELN